MGRRHQDESVRRRVQLNTPVALNLNVRRRVQSHTPVAQNLKVNLKTVYIVLPSKAFLPFD